MRRQSKKLSGPVLARYLRRFFAETQGLPPEAAESLARRAIAAFTSIRVRAEALGPQRPLAGPVHRESAVPAVAPPPQQESTRMPSAPAAPAPSDRPAAPFDPFAIGLVPTFQREGREGLMKRLATISSLEDLRKMARSQNIVLPEPLRAGNVAAESVRSGIVDAVAKRIADRRAAAG